MGNGKGIFGMYTKRRIFLLAFTGVVSLAGLWWFYTSLYLEVYVSIPSYHRDIWHRTSRSTISNYDQPGVEYVLRREGTAYTSVLGWQKASDGLSYFDRWFAERGWQRTDMYTEGDPTLPETEFLKFGENFAIYTRPEDTSGFAGSNKGASGRITVAVWPVTGCDQDVIGFNVVMVTARPSLIRALHDAIDD